MTSKYAAASANPSGPGDARPTALQIIQDEGLRGKLQDKVFFITGCSSGIGIETVRALEATGATIFATARSLDKAKEALGSLVESDRVHLLEMDQNSLASVRACATKFLSLSKKLHVLIPNAGVMATPEGRTADGFETQFGVNYLAHFLLFWLLKPALLASSTPAFHSRVVVVSSMAHRHSDVHFDNLNLEGEYDPHKAYGQSKTALVWAANEIERRYGGAGLHATSLHPGGIKSGLQVHVSQEMLDHWGKEPSIMKMWKSPEQGAATTVWAAVAAELEGTGGVYLEDCMVSGPWEPESGWAGPGYSAWAMDQDKAEKLWVRTLSILELEDGTD
ncbi:hypothetical protein M1834_005974 [Neofusicoccum parvum]|nr:hypothetical protein M1834_005974 [Neofusicoccum parvum]